ncbi:MAG: AEC family transporter [Lachnospiraceae bacterium]|nr:AEC family transporter [Lachnospiraceae bacterium]
MVLLHQMLAMLIFMMIGYYMSRRAILDLKGEKMLSWLILNVANPAMMIASSISEDNTLMPDELLQTLAAALLTYAVLILLSLVFPQLMRAPGGQRGVYREMVVFSNMGFMGFPLAAAMFGPAAVVVTSIFTIPFNLLIYTYGILIFEQEAAAKEAGEKKQKKDMAANALKKLINPGMLCSILGVIFTLLHPSLPDFAEVAVTHLSRLTASLSMMVIGASLTAFHLPDLFRDIRLLVFTLIRLIVFPIVLLSAARALVPDASEQLMNALFIVLATPVASMVAMLAQQNRGDYKFAAKGVAVSTILSVVTMPFVAWVLGL